MMQETVSPRCDAFEKKPKKLYRKRTERDNDDSTLNSSKNSGTSSNSNSNDWHRLLLGRLKPGMTGKYRTTGKIGDASQTFTAISSDESNVTLRAYSDGPSALDNDQKTNAHSRTFAELDSSIDSATRRDNRFVKNFPSNRPGDHMTSLKRRVRKQQMRLQQNRATILDETTFSLHPTANLLLMSYSQPVAPSRRYIPNRANFVVPLPPISNDRRTAAHPIQDIQLNLCAY